MERAFAAADAKEDPLFPDAETILGGGGAARSGEVRPRATVWGQPCTSDFHTVNGASVQIIQLRFTHDQSAQI